MGKLDVFVERTEEGAHAHKYLAGALAEQAVYARMQAVDVVDSDIVGVLNAPRLKRAVVAQSATAAEIAFLSQRAAVAYKALVADMARVAKSAVRANYAALSQFAKAIQGTVASDAAALT